MLWFCCVSERRARAIRFGRALFGGARFARCGWIGRAVAERVQPVQRKGALHTDEVATLTSARRRRGGRAMSSMAGGRERATVEVVLRRARVRLRLCLKVRSDDARRVGNPSRARLPISLSCPSLSHSLSFTTRATTP